MMRRKDLEVTDPARMEAVLKACPFCHLGLNDDGKVYMVPLSFGYRAENGTFTLYFHSAKAGKKLDLLRKTGYASFVMETNYQLNPDPNPCDYSVRYECLMGSGKAEFIEDPEEKKAALLAIMDHMTGRTDWTFGEGAFKNTCVFKVTPEDLSCKAHG